MAIGDSIKKAFQKVGTPYTLYRKNQETVSGEYFMFDIPEVFNSWEREYLRKAIIQYDSLIKPGQVVLPVSGEYHLIAHIADEPYASEILMKEAILMKCNVTGGKLLRSSGETYDTSEYHTKQNWVVTSTGIKATVVEAQMNLAAEDAGMLQNDKITVYLPSGEDVQLLDRWEPYSGEWYQVDTVKKHIMGPMVVEVSVDTRE